MIPSAGIQIDGIQSEDRPDGQGFDGQGWILVGVECGSLGLRNLGGLGGGTGWEGPIMHMHAYAYIPSIYIVGYASQPPALSLGRLGD